MKINVKALSGCEPEQHGDWIDLKASEDIIYLKGEVITVNLGVCIELPEGYEAHLLPRSSTFKKYDVIMVNSMGIIDNAYCGDNDWWKIQFYALNSGYISKGDRIAQFRVMPVQENITINQVMSLKNPDRGGIGSTGR